MRTSHRSTCTIITFAFFAAACGGTESPSEVAETGDQLLYRPVIISEPTEIYPDYGWDFGDPAPEPTCSDVYISANYQCVPNNTGCGPYEYSNECCNAAYAAGGATIKWDNKADNACAAQGCMACPASAIFFNQTGNCTASTCAGSATGFVRCAPSC